MKAGALVPDSMILRLIVNELSTLGWIRDSTLRPYAVYSSSFAEADMTVDSVSIPSSIKTAKYTYSDHPDASFILDGFPLVVGLNNAIELSRTAPQFPGKPLVVSPIVSRAELRLASSTS